MKTDYTKNEEILLKNILKLPLPSENEKDYKDFLVKHVSCFYQKEYLEIEIIQAKTNNLIVIKLNLNFLEDAKNLLKRFDLDI
jgi:hypothetical protein